MTIWWYLLIMAVQYFVCTLGTYYCQNNLLWHEIDIKKKHGSSTTMKTMPAQNKLFDIGSVRGRWNNISITIYNCSGRVDMIDNNNSINNNNHSSMNNSYLMSTPNLKMKQVQVSIDVVLSL